MGSSMEETNLDTLEKERNSDNCVPDPNKDDASHTSDLTSSTLPTSPSTLPLLSASSKPDLSALSVSEPVYRSYSTRWWLLSTVVLLNLANYSHWVAFPSVTKMTARYYGQSGQRMDLIPTLSYGLGVPFCLVATYVVDRHGLKQALHIGGVLTGLGGLLCAISSVPSHMMGLELTGDTRFLMALVGQACTGVACPFISCVPTKISQHWFGEHQRALATIILGMANPMGIVLGQLITPIIVQSPEQVATMNTLWCAPAAIGALLTLTKVRSDRPPTPPSASAATQTLLATRYWPSMVSLFCNKAFLVLFAFVGGAMGFVSTMSTKIEQIMCASGYSDQLSGLSGSLILFVGVLASFPFGILAFKTQKPVLICKVCAVVGLVSMATLTHFMRVADSGHLIVLFSVLMGAFTLGPYPLVLELLVECTYPVDQALGTALLFLSSAVQGVFLMHVEGSFGSELSKEEMLKQSCVPIEVGDDGLFKTQGHEEPKKYGGYLNFLVVYMLVLVVIFVVGFYTDLRRTKADKIDPERVVGVVKGGDKIVLKNNDDDSDSGLGKAAKDDSDIV